MISTRVKKLRISLPYALVKLFEEQLQFRGIPIRFEASLPRELSHAKQLLRHCKGSREEAEALIREFCRDEWEMEHNPSLSRVVAILDELRARIAKRQQRARSSVDEMLRL